MVYSETASIGYSIRGQTWTVYKSHCVYTLYRERKKQPSPQRTATAGPKIGRFHSTHHNLYHHCIEVAFGHVFAVLGIFYVAHPEKVGSPQLSESLDSTGIILPQCHSLMLIHEVIMIFMVDVSSNVSL